MTNTEISNADKIMLGDTEALAMYIGSTQIWQNTPPYDARLEYIGSSGSQFIDTEIVPDITKELSIEIHFAITGQNTQNSTIVGTVDTRNKRYYLLSNDGNGLYVCRFAGNWNSSKIAQSGGKLVTDRFYTVYTSINPNGVSMNYTNASNNNVSVTSVSEGDSISLSIYLFSRHTASGTSNSASCRIDYIKFYEDNNLISHMIAVKKDNVGYMYDTVRKKLYGNGGTGSFTLGSEINS